VVARHGALAFPLVEKFVPQGYLEVYAVLDDATLRPAIVVQTRSGMGCGAEGSFALGLEKFSFDPEGQAYVRDDAMEVSGAGACRGGMR
jgi:hypothetical protein